MSVIAYKRLKVCKAEQQGKDYYTIQTPEAIVDMCRKAICPIAVALFRPMGRSQLVILLKRKDNLARLLLSTQRELGLLRRRVINSLLCLNFWSWSCSAQDWLKVTPSQEHRGDVQIWINLDVGRLRWLSSMI